MNMRPGGPGVASRHLAPCPKLALKNKLRVLVSVAGVFLPFVLISHGEIISQVVRAGFTTAECFFKLK